MKRSALLLTTLMTLWLPSALYAQLHAGAPGVWVSDNGDGTYKNPVLFADYSDPDAIRVNNDYYMVASSFNCIPGLPILHSRDLVNWELIGHALQTLPPAEVFAKVQHGGGVWAPCIRYHNHAFYIYYPDPDFGIFMVKAVHPAGPWSEPVCVAKGRGLIDCTPLWDDDGRAYLGYAFAGSRAGVKSVLMVSQMNPEGTALIGQSVLVFDGHRNDPTVEGPKLYKRNGYYYIFAPAGGVAPGWQLAMRSRNIFGPYESRKVLAQGKSPINGPHQGAWVDTPSGENWFIHFQDRGLYGRLIHLNPLKWVNDWPVIGIDPDGDGIGEPVTRYKKPQTGLSGPILTPAESDEFNTPVLGLQWQWHANYQTVWGYPSGNLGFYRLNCIPWPENAVNLWSVSNLMLQKFPAPEFRATARLTFDARFDGEEVNLVVMGLDYARIGLIRENGKLFVRAGSCLKADKGGAELFTESIPLEGPTVELTVRVDTGGICTFGYRTDGKEFTYLGPSFTARQGMWIGAKVGFCALRKGMINDAGSADIDWFRIEKL